MLQRNIYNLWLPENRLLDQIWQLIAVSIAAQMTTFPLSAVLFPSVSQLFSDHQPHRYSPLKPRDLFGYACSSNVAHCLAKSFLFTPDGLVADGLKLYRKIYRGTSLCHVSAYFHFQGRNVFVLSDHL